MAKTKGKSKKELLTEQIAVAIAAGREVAVETVDFSDPDRPKTCLEVDFPIIPINQIAVIEGNAGKPIYQMSKWWARRRSSVFRSMLFILNGWTAVRSTTRTAVNTEAVRPTRWRPPFDGTRLVPPNCGCSKCEANCQNKSRARKPM